MINDMMGSPISMELANFGLRLITEEEPLNTGMIFLPA